MKPSDTGLDRILLVRRQAGGVNDKVITRLEKALPDYLMLDLHHDDDFVSRLSDRATVVVAGGDGSISHVCRKLAGTRHRLGILPLGTYNNFARALRIPASLRGAVEVVREGRPRKVHLGRIGDRYFLEAAAIGLFGEVIATGEDAKDGEFGNLVPHLRRLAADAPFKFRISGDIEAEGETRSIVLANTPSTGNRMAVGEGSPLKPYLELSLGVGVSRRDVVGRALASMVLDTHDDEAGIRIHVRKLRVETKPKVKVYADKDGVGWTPIEISLRAALRILVP